MNIQIQPFACRAVGVHVSIIKQSFVVAGAIGDASSYLQRDYACSHENQCDRRHVQDCAVYRRNTAI